MDENLSKRGGVAACIEYPVKTKRGIMNELLEIHQAARTAISTGNDESRKLIVSMDVILKDVEKSEMGEFFASRLLTPFKIHTGEDTIKNLAQKYLERTILEIIYDTVNDYGMGVFRMSFLPQYFLYKKIKARVSLYPPASRIYWWVNESSGELFRKVLRNVEEELDNLCQEGLLIKSGEGYYSINQEVAKKLDMGKPGASLSGLRIDSRITNLFKTGRIGIMSPMLLISETVNMPIDEQSIDPDQYIFINTSTGSWPLSSNQDVYELINNYIQGTSEKIEITKTGSLFNSTYVAVVQRDSEAAKRFFIKRYESWTDVKWVVAKIWAMHLRNFYYSASMRLGNELFYLSYLKEHRFNVPNIIHVDWERKIIIEEAIDGVDLIRVWTKKQTKSPEDASRTCGETLAKIHRKGVVIGDCKPDNFVMDNSGDAWIVDLEQASFRGDQSWDVAECILYMGHYIDGEELENYTSSFISGYLKFGDQRTVEKALDPRYQFVMMPWTPIWSQLRAVETVRRVLKS